MMNIKMIAGLGNPGSQYQDTRHNAGHWWCDLLAQKFELEFKQNKRCLCESAQCKLAEEMVYIVKPTTFMNDSAKAILASSQFYKIPIEDILIVHDELDLETGTIRFKQGGGHGGHNGLRDIMRVFAKKDFPRLRIGIGHPGDRHKVHDYVLSKPSQIDKDKIVAAMDRSIQLIDLLLNHERDRFIQTLHTVN